MARFNQDALGKSSEIAQRLAKGTFVRFTAEELAWRPDFAKTYSGRVGMIDGYRLGATDPIVYFPKDGRRKEHRLFEVATHKLEIAPPPEPTPPAAKKKRAAP